ncbi:MAG: TraM recognition domain-containing protein, partial [Nitrospirae bacterium]|nr:TraM recognition domain-containing protein [Nitrospirota bacterium]
RPMFLYVDEFQNFTTDTVAYLLSEARKFGLYLTLANQNLAQLSANSGRQSVLDAVLGNVGTTLILRLGALDADKMDIYTRPELQAQDLQNLPDFHAAGRLLVKNCPSRPFVFKTLAGLDITDQIHADDVINISRNKYASPVRQVEEGIKARRSMYKYCVET